MGYSFIVCTQPRALLAGLRAHYERPASGCHYAAQPLNRSGFFIQCGLTRRSTGRPPAGLGPRVGRRLASFR